MKDKHSRGELLKGLDLIPEYVGLDTKWKEQIKSLLTSIPEEKLKEFVEKWAHKTGLFLQTVERMLKEYEKEKESSDEK